VISNDEIFNSLIKKENGVNPFLTIMNFKISFRTWLKEAKEHISHGNLVHDMTAQQCSYKKLVVVDIEVEEEIEVTSEEDDMNVSHYGNSRNFPYSASKSNEES